MELNWCERLRDRNKKQNCRNCSRRQHNCKGGQLALWKEGERLGNNTLAKRAKVLSRHSCRSPPRGCLSNQQIPGDFVI